MEVLRIDDEIRATIIRGGGQAEIRDMGVQNGMVTLLMAVLERVKDGVTSIEAALAVTGGGH